MIDIYRGQNVVHSFKPSNDTLFSHELMGEHKITARIKSVVELDLRIGDYLMREGEVFTINAAPEVTRHSMNDLEYELVFEGETYRLYKKILMDEGQADFGAFGRPLDYLHLVVDNINEIDPGWQIGNVFDDLEPQHISFNNESCRVALTRIAEAFNLEYHLTDRTINLVQKVGNDINLTLEYGKGKGLYTLTRRRLNDKNVFTKLYAFGSDKNISYDYRDGAKRLIFEEKFLTKNTGLYGTIEHSETFDIFPSRTAAITAVNTSNIFQIIDTTLNFNINDLMLEGTTPKVIFKSGALQGNAFEIVRYNHTTKTITFKEVVEENDYRLPNALNKPEVGDLYTLVDIKMPQIYIDEAELKLKQKAQEMLDEYSHPKVSYTFRCDEKFIRDYGLSLNIGDRVRILDVGLNVDAVLRISNVQYPLSVPSRIEATITEGLQYTTEEQLIRVTAESKRLIKTVDRTGAEAARVNTMRMRELQQMVFDPDGYFDGTHIKPNSIETIHLAVGVKSQQFVLPGIVFAPNQNALPARFGWTMGSLVHYELEENIRTWEIAAGSRLDLVNANAYYIYAKCPVVGSQATIVLDTAQIKVTSVAGFYHFLVGVLHSVVDGVRGISLTYGTTQINGKFIKGILTSDDGLSYINLNTGDFIGKFTFRSGKTDAQVEADVANAQTTATNANTAAATAQTAANNVQSGLVSLQNSLGALAYNDLVEFAKLGNTIVEGGYLKTSLINTSALIVSGGLETVQGAQAKVDAIVVGGRNILRGSDPPVFVSPSGARSTLVDGWARIAWPMGDYEVWFDGPQLVVEPNQYYTQSLMFRTDATFVRFYCSFFSSATGHENVEVTIIHIADELYQAYVSSITKENQNRLRSLNLRAFTLSNATYIEFARLKVEKGNKATDWTPAPEDVEADATAKADAAQAAATAVANAAQSTANAANNLLTDIASDSKLTPDEKQATKKEWDIIASEKAKIESEADKFGASKTAYTNAYNSLSSYITPLLSSLTTTSDIVGSTFRTNFKNYYDARQDILNAITTKAKQLADAAQSTATSAQSGLVSLQNSLGALAYDDLVAAAMSRESLIIGGYFNTVLIDTSALIVSGGLETVQGAQAKVNALASQLGDMAYAEKVSASMLDDTLIVGGYIKSSLIDVDTLIAKHVKTSETGRRVHIDGYNNRMTFHDSSGFEAMKLDDNVGSDEIGNPLAGITIRRQSPSRASNLTGSGIFSNASKYAFLPAYLGVDTNASVVGLLFDRNSDSEGISAGVVGRDDTSTGNSESYGGWFNSLFAGGLHVAMLRTTASTLFLNDKHTFIVHYGTSPATIYLPGSSSRKPGKAIFVIRRNVIALKINANGAMIARGTSEVTEYEIDDAGNVWSFWWDGQVWIAVKLSRA